MKEVASGANHDNATIYKSHRTVEVLRRSIVRENFHYWSTSATEITKPNNTGSLPVWVLEVKIIPGSSLVP